MDTKKILQHINTHDWYRQGAAVKPLYISYPYEACSHFTVHEKLIAPYYFGYLGFHKNDFMNYYFTSQSAQKVCAFYIAKQNTQPGFLEKLKQRWEEKHFYPTWNICKKNNTTDFSTLKNSELIKTFKYFSKLYETAWQESIFLDGFDIHSEKIANEVIFKYDSKISNNDLQILTSPKERTWVQKSEIELLNLLKQKNNIKERLGTHTQKWYWIQNDYAHVEKLGVKHFTKKLEAYKKNKSLLNKKGKELEQFELNKKHYASIVKRVKIKQQDLNILNGLATLAVWRDLRKSFNQMASYTAKLFAQEIALRTKIPLTDLEELFYQELIPALKNPNRAKTVIRERKNGIVITDYPNRKVKITNLTPNLAKIRVLLDGLISKQGLKGSPAFTGVVKGKAKIILSQKDFYKMKKGDILVAPNTRPEYVPIMKLAGAIISEEGGITCHSAIVSRELKIPCIVGVQGATNSLKDNDLIEVDANTGKIIKLLIN